jgi:hypothetical protein
MDEESEAAVRRRPRWPLALLAVFLLIIVIILAIWSQRRDIAADYIQRELSRRGVQATYEVKQIGFRTQRLESLVIGDPRRPDLTARWVEVEVSIGIRRPRVSLITARGVRLHGRVAGGRVSLGQVDKLMPPPSGKPFRLPNQRIDVADAAIRLDTPAGVVGFSLEGEGNLAYSFEGKMAGVSRGLRLSKDCSIEAPAFFATVTTKEEQPTFKGPLRASAIDCGGVELTRPHLVLDTLVNPGFDGARGTTRVEVVRLQSGKHTFAGLTGRVGFAGGLDRVRGTMDLAAASAAVGDYRAGRVAMNGRYAIAPDAGNVSVLADLAANNVSGRGSLAAVEAAFDSADGSPIGPIARALAAAVRRAGQGFDARASVRVVNGPGYGAARVERMRMLSRSGAALAFAGRKGLTYYWPSASARIDTDLTLTGGGFPATRIRLAQARPGASIRGVAEIAPMQAGGARLRLDDVRFTAAPGGVTRIDTIALLDGPFSGGGVQGLLVPVSGRFGGGSFAFGERCTNVSFRALRLSGLLLGPTRLPLCPTGRALVWAGPNGRVAGGAAVRQLRLAGRLGQSPITLAADSARFGLAESAFTSSGVAIRLGPANRVNRLDLASLSGRIGPRGIAGGFGGGDAKLANVPLLLSEGRGSWSLAGGRAEVKGALTVADEAALPRFYPLASNDFRLMLEGERIDAAGSLLDPESGNRVAEVKIAHNLPSGRGNALLEVPGITFGPDFQPEALTRLTTGVVALVNGSVRGEGEIGWGPDGVRSTGSFTSDDMSLAAAFGPVEGLSGTINFDDLLGLQTAPGQVASVRVIRTGIDVFDGQIRYQLLPNLRIRVEGGRWPFAGGELFLEETILDFSKPTMKRLVFRVDSLDAARFIQLMEFSNITATGTFDGTVPMEFPPIGGDGGPGGGRIVGGSLRARPEGGTLSYIGELTDKDLGAYGKLAFDALKSMRYNKLTIALDGSLDGEFLAGIELDGIARDPVLTSVGAGGGVSGMVARRALGQLAKIPFEFNIKIRGPFRALIATARSFEDPSNLIQSVLPRELQERKTTMSVQPKESETVR